MYFTCPLPSAPALKTLPVQEPQVLRAGGGPAPQVDCAAVAPNQSDLFLAVELQTILRFAGMRRVPPPGFGLNGAGISAHLGAGHIFQLRPRPAGARRNHHFGIVVIGVVLALLPTTLESLFHFRGVVRRGNADQSFDRW